jgi:hypothetical protein
MTFAGAIGAGPKNVRGSCFLTVKMARVNKLFPAYAKNICRHQNR